MAGASLDADHLAGRYRLVERIGVGGSSSVFRAWDERERVFRAVKILAPRLAGNAEVRERLLREAAVLSRLRHPNVVAVHGADVDGERLFLVLELLTGGSALERLAEGPLPPRMATAVVMGALAGLQAAHDLGVVHRDVKPANLLLDADGTVKVTDFGIARTEDAASMTRAGAVLGTLAYMPPEQKSAGRRVDVRADVYSAGATLVALLTRRAPHDLYAAALDDRTEAELLGGVPAALGRVIRQATAFRAEDRFASASALSAALAAAVAELPEDPPSPPLVAVDRVKRQRALSRLGPTLLGTTDSGEDGEPAPIPEPPVRRTLPIAVAAGVLLLGTAAAAGWFAQEVVRGTPAPAPAPAGVAVVAPEPPAPVTPVDTGGPTPAAAPDGEDDVSPNLRAPLIADDGEDAPSEVRSVGRWEILWWPTGRRRADVTATLAAEAADGGSEPAVLIARCVNRKPVVALRTGKVTAGERVEVAITTSSGSEKVRAVADPRLQGLVFPAGSAWIERLLAEPTFTLAFVGPNGPAEARFSHGPGSGDGAEVRAALAPCLGVR